MTRDAAAPSARPRPGVLVETATWPPLEVHDVDGWHVGWSHGFTRRGNSAWRPEDPGDLRAGDLDAVLTRVERLYADRAAPSIVRVSPDRDPVLDDHLARRGYAAMAPTVVMVAPQVRPAPGPPDGWEVDVTTEPDEEWVHAWLGVKTTTTSDLSTARRLLGGASARYLAVRDVDGVAGVLRAATVGEWVGLSCLAVAPRARRRGLAGFLTRTAIAGASQRRVFLQVEEANHAARALYAGLGFEVTDRYVYRQR